MIDTPWAFCEMFVRDGRLGLAVTCRSEEVARAARRYVGCGSVRRRRLLFAEKDVARALTFMAGQSQDTVDLVQVVEAYLALPVTGQAHGVAQGAVLGRYRAMVDRVQNA
jgi:hypothetical protein